MKKRTILVLVVILVIASIVKASPVDPQHAIKVAQEFVPKSTAQRAPIRGSQTEPSSSIVYTHMMPNSDRPAFYIVNVDDGAFVLVSADDIAHQVLGYSLSSTWPVSRNGSVELPAHIKGFFDDLAAQMEAAVESKPTRAAGSYKASSRSSAPNRSPSLPDSVGPLLTTTWDQGQYYNALCPEDANGPDGHVYTGCVATAMAQIVKYWSDPTPGRGTHSYSTNYGTLTVNYENDTYDFANMSDNLSSSSTPEQVTAVAKLMYHCGVAANMDYGSSVSSSFEQDARAGLINFFRFSPDMSFAEKSNFSELDWNNLLRQEIAANHPVMYSGRGDGGGHSFILDGYKSGNYYHFNFGWGGFADGWFLTNAVAPSGNNFSSSQSAIIGITPATNSNVIIGQMKGKSTFIVEEPLEFCHTMGYNTYEGKSYSNDCNNEVSFISAIDGKQLVVDFVDFEDQQIDIYDGANLNTWLRGLSGGSENDLGPIVSTQNGITIMYTGALYYYGFKIQVSLERDLRMVSNIVSFVESTTVNLTWQENGNATQWQIEYGLKGFELGRGTVYNDNTNTATFNDLEKFTEYDFYIRSVSDNSQYGPWNKVTLMIEAPYWQDVVTSQPEGYDNRSYNTVNISTAEGLAWWARNGCEYDAYLTTDIDLSGYKWRPITDAWHNLFGQGHVISNAYINEHIDDVGLFTDYGKDGTIADVGLENFNVIGRGNRTGGLCGTLRGTIRNCYIKNSVIDGGDYTGGLIGESNYGTIINCYANADVIGNRWTGLMIGDSWQGTNRNCYAAGTLRHRSYCYNAGIAAYAGAGEITNCYSVMTEMGCVGYKGSTHIADTSTFIKSDVDCTLLTPVVFDGQPETTLISALNRWVELNNDSVYYTWCLDTNKNNGGFPVFGNKYVVRCPNVTEVSTQNVESNGNNAVVISWIEKGNATQWQIRYRRHDMPDADYTYVITSNNPATIQGIPLGYVYDFNVRAIDGENKSGWSETKTLIVDLLYWTDVVTTKPAGFMVDNDGNVEISSAEGLAWLAVMVNGFHGQTANTYDGKTVTITADINLEGYRWYPIGRYINYEWKKFSGIFDGQGHIITNIYVNDAWSDLGLFGRVDKGRIRNISIESGTISSIYTDRTDAHALHSSAVGGLIGYGEDCYEINNCHSSATIYANGGAGSLCGEIRGNEIKTIVSNCSASGSVYGRESCGGLIGDVYGEVEVRNCFASGNVEISVGNENACYRGGLIGNFMYASVYNSYSLGTVNIDPNSYGYIGNVIGCPYLNTHIHFVYGQNNINADFGLIGNYCEDISDTAHFDHNGANNTLLSPVKINNVAYSDLLEALNAWVYSQNDQKLKTWIMDGNTGYPVFGGYFEPSCYNPSDLSVTNATEVGDTTIKTEVSWIQIGNPDHWEVLYVASGQNISEGTIVPVSSNPCLLRDIPIGHPLDFYVRAVNSDGSASYWSSSVTYIPDKLRWTEVVTNQPEGYTEDANGNVFISSAEGLAWLSSIVNGLNGNIYNTDRFYNKRIILTSDIDVSAYRWISIGVDESQHFLHNVLFEGNGHTIHGLYCNELADYQGLFGYFWSGTVSNLTINQCNVYGEKNTAAIIGDANGVDIINCAVVGNVSGIENIGGLAGGHNGAIIKNSFMYGNVYYRNDITINGSIGGYMGGICGTPLSNTIANCYVVSEIAKANHSGIITGSCGIPDTVSNCYYKLYTSNIPITTDCHTANNSSFSGDGIIWTLNSPSFINGVFYTDLVDALNAWVDENCTDERYRRWVADTNIVNGGYPIFESEYVSPTNGIVHKYLVQFRDIDGTLLQVDTLEYGDIPEYRGVTPFKEPTSEFQFEFSGWSSEFVPVTGFAIYYATYTHTSNKYVIKFCDENNSVLQAEMLEYGAIPTYRGPQPTKESTSQYLYTFKGWTPEVSSVTGDATYIAVFDKHLFGDVTGSGVVDVQDATIVVNYILGDFSDDYDYYLADLNKDNEIDVFDITAMINVILGKSNFMAPIRSVGGGYKSDTNHFVTASPSNAVSLENIYLQFVSDKISLSVNNPARFTSFQMDIEVPDRAELQNVELTGSKSTHMIQKAKIGDNQYRVIALSMNSQPLADVNDELVSFQITNAANAEVSVSNVMFVTPKGEAHYFNGASIKTPTIINEITTDNNEVIFDLSGRRIYKKPNDLESGMYIINKKKVIIK